MTDELIRERVARAIAGLFEGCEEDWQLFECEADAALGALRPGDWLRENVKIVDLVETYREEIQRIRENRDEAARKAAKRMRERCAVEASKFTAYKTGGVIAAIRALPLEEGEG